VLLSSEDLILAMLIIQRGRSQNEGLAHEVSI
jgi:hypothetical protein